jgi:NTE family protein
VTRIGLVLGAGGLVGSAFHAGVLRALREATGWDPRQAEIIVGTSAGSYVGAQLRAGAPVGRVATRSQVAPAGAGRRFAPAAPSAVVRGLTRPGSARIGSLVAAALPAGRLPLDGLAGEVNALHSRGWPRDRLWLPAVRLRDGARVVFGRDEHPDVGSAVAASCAVPGYFAPVRIGTERYVDGGAHSVTNADLLAGEGLDLVVVISPMAAARGVRTPSALLQGRGAMRLRLATEARAVRRSGAQVVAFSPTPDDLAVMGWNAMDGRRRQLVMDRSYASALRRLQRADVAELFAAQHIPGGR